MMSIGYQVCLAVGVTTILCASIALYAALVGS